MAGRLYVTENKTISKMIQRNSEWIALQGNGNYLEKKAALSPLPKQLMKQLPDRLIELDPQAIYDGTFLLTFEKIFDIEKKRGAFLVNAFSPSEEGSLLFQLFLQYSGFVESGQCMRQRYLGEEETRGSVVNLAEQKRQAEALKVWFWTKGTANTEITEKLAPSGAAAVYDLFLTPICAEIERRRKEISSFAADKEKGVGVIGKAVFCGEPITLQLCDENGKRFRIPEEKARHICKEERRGKVIEKISTRHILMPPEPYDFLSLLQELDGRVQMRDAEDFLTKLYAEGYINYPFSGERKVNQAVFERMARPQNLRFFYERKIKWFPLAAEIVCERKETAGGIVLLRCSDADLETLYNNAGNVERQILDLLITRQLALFSQPAETQMIKFLVKSGENYFTGEMELLVEGGWRRDAYGEVEMKPKEINCADEEVFLDLKIETDEMPKLHSISSLITWLKIHAIENDCITAILHDIGSMRPGYIGCYDGKFLLHRVDRTQIEELPECIKSLTLAADLLTELQKVRNGKITAEVYMDFIRQRLDEIKEEIERSERRE